MTDTKYFHEAGVSFEGATGHTKKVKHSKRALCGETYSKDDYDRRTFKKNPDPVYKNNSGFDWSTGGGYYQAQS